MLGLVGVCEPAGSVNFCRQVFCVDGDVSAIYVALIHSHEMSHLVVIPLTRTGQIHANLKRQHNIQR